MRIDTKNLKRLLLLNFPYVFLGLFATNLGEGWRLAEGTNSSEKLLSFMTTLPAALQNPLPSLHPMDLLIGILCGAALRLAVYLKGKNAKKYRHNTEYGSARWGTHKDIEPFMDENPENNIILTKTEGLTMSSRPKNPANARNKNVLIVGGSGSGKSRNIVIPNLMNANTSFMVLDPKGELLRTTGNLLKEEGYEIRVLDLIRMERSHCYNPFRYIRNDADIQKLVTILFDSTTPKGSHPQEPYWDQMAGTLLKALMFLLYYEAPNNEQSFQMVLELIRAGEIDILVSTTVVEVQTASTTTTVEFEAEVGVVAVAVAVLV